MPLPVTGSRAEGIPYERMRAIRGSLDLLRPYIRETVVDQVLAAHPGNGLIHFIADEPDRGRAGWFWPPELLHAYNDIVRETAPGQLTYIDFGGSLKGNRLYYEQRFGPGLRTGTEPVWGACSPENMSTYDYTHDGEPVYEYRRGRFGRGSWVERPDSLFARCFFQNVSRTAEAYRNASDICGVNAYGEFRDYPELAGEIVDAIRAGCGPSKPVWPFFDASAVAQSRNMDDESYVALVRCQIYTAIIHGATGVLFYAADLPADAARNFWPLIRDLADTLADQRGIFESAEVARGWDTRYHEPGYDHLHWTVRADSRGNRWLIAANTSRTATRTLAVEGFPAVDIEPLGVAVLSVAGD
jgi:hypothetical protein